MKTPASTISKFFGIAIGTMLMVPMATHAVTSGSVSDKAGQFAPEWLNSVHYTELSTKLTNKVRAICENKGGISNLWQYDFKTNYLNLGGIMVYNGVSGSATYRCNR